MYRHDAVLALIAQLYREAMGSGDWVAVLKALTMLFDGHAAFTMNVGAGAHESPQLYSYTLPLESFVAYGEYYYQHDLWSPIWLSQGLHNQNTVCSGDQLVAQEVFERSIWFNEFLRPYDIEHSMFAALVPDDRTPAILVIDRPLGSAPFSATDRERLRPLVEHFSRALDIAKQFQRLNEGIDAHEAAVDSYQLGILSINRQGHVVYANNAATIWLTHQAHLVIKRGLLCAQTTTGQREMAKILAFAAQGFGHRWTIAGKPPLKSLTLKSLPLGMTSNASERLAQDLQPGKIVLLLTLENTDRNDSYLRFAKRYQLTRQEINVLQAMTEGFSTREIAERHQVSYNTVRSQLASLLQKTGCKRQLDLLRIMMSG